MIDILRDVASNHKRHTPYNQLVIGIQKAMNLVARQVAEIKSTKTYFGHLVAPVIALPKTSAVPMEGNDLNSGEQFEAEEERIHQERVATAGSSTSSSSSSSAATSRREFTILTSKHPAQGVGAIGDLARGVPPPLIIPRKGAADPRPAGTCRADTFRQNADGWHKEDMLMRNLVDTENRKLAIDEQRVQNETKKLANEERMQSAVLEMFRASMKTRGEVPVFHEVPTTFNDDGSVRLSHTVVDTDGVTHRMYDV
jgi:hypothetical protein